MAQLDVEPKKNNDWWKWLVGILAAIIIIWVIVEATGTDDGDDIDEMEEPVAATLTTSLINPETDYIIA